MLATTTSQFAILKQQPQFAISKQQSSSLDFLARVLRSGWLRRDTPSESPSLTPMESQAEVNIRVFPEKEIPENRDDDGVITAQSDKSLPISIISKGMLDRLGVVCTPCQQQTVTDSRNVQHSPVGKVTLRWHKTDGAKSYSDVFFVVDRQSRQVILGNTAFPAGNCKQPSGSNIYPIGVHPQTADEKLTMEQKKLQVAQRREQEKKAQEEKEAERRK
ncbi:MAG: hypothetical protein Q9215_003493 [Flavoplaca cf. flavocitrina]